MIRKSLIPAASIRSFIALAALALAACGALPAAPVEVRTTTKEVLVPVPTPCFEESDRPPLPVYTFKTQEEIDRATPKQRAQAIHADRIADELYSRAVDDLFVKCMKAQGREPR